MAAHLAVIDTHVAACAPVPKTVLALRGSYLGCREASALEDAEGLKAEEKQKQNKHTKNNAVLAVAAMGFHTPGRCRWAV